MFAVRSRVQGNYFGSSRFAFWVEKLGQISGGHKHGQKNSHRNFIPCSRQHFSWIYSLCQPFCHISSKKVSFSWKTVFLILDQFQKSEFSKKNEKFKISKKKKHFSHLPRIKNTVFHQKQLFFDEILQNGGQSRHIQEICYQNHFLNFLYDFFGHVYGLGKFGWIFQPKILRNETLKSRNFLKKLQSLSQS